MKGKIVRWVDDRGFGFIHAQNLRGDIFVHISTFKKGYRRPEVGDEVTFHLEQNSQNLRVKNARLIGVAPLKSDPFSIMISYLLFFILAIGVYIFVIEPMNNPAYESMGFSCSGKVYCSQMTSCDEARFYLAHCPGVKIDGDRDGIPCERQYCGG